MVYIRNRLLVSGSVSNEQIAQPRTDLVPLRNRSCGGWCFGGSGTKCVVPDALGLIKAFEAFDLASDYEIIDAEDSDQ